MSETPKSIINQYRVWLEEAQEQQKRDLGNIAYHRAEADRIEATQEDLSKTIAWLRSSAVLEAIANG